MRIATWNVNSVRARHDRLLAWLGKTRPDVLCLQELKCEDDKFPLEAVRAAGYHAAVYGQKTYNGVAILAREALTDVVRGWGGEPGDSQARLVAASVGHVRVMSVYVPNGSEVGSDKYAYKLAWLERMAAYLKQRHRPDAPLVVCGDFNIAPHDRDISDLATWGDGIFASSQVRAGLQRLLDWGLEDVLRRHNDEAGVYSWWDYRQLAFPKNKGLRIDLVLGTPAIAARSTAAFVDRDERKGAQPSDHAPVVVDFDV